ncbi:MAG: terminase family protein [Candidatus Peribacteraceae bacterium]|nr:terminase family protein [Candidatus Peribacteraceae bacterium]
MNFRLHQHQDRVMDAVARFILVLTGVQGGKTTIGAIWLLARIYESYKAGRRGDWLIAAPTEKILQQSTLVNFKSFFPADWGVWKEQKKCFELAWGDKVFVRSTENPEHLEGMTLLGAWLDEAGQMKARVWTYMQARVAVNRGPVLMTTTPYAMNWLYREVMKRAKEGDSDYALITWKSVDNPAFPKEDFERARRTLPKAIFERRYLGLFTRLEGLVYPDFDTDTHVIEPVYTIPENWECFGGMDFGHTNPTCILPLYWDKRSDTYYVVDEFYEREASLKKISIVLDKHPYKKVFADRQSAHLIAELQHQYGCKSIAPCDNSIDVGIERITKLLKEGKLKFFRGKCPNMLEEIEAYHYPPPNEDKEVKDKPVPIKNHAMDALRYAFSKPLPRSADVPRRRQAQRFSNRIRNVNPYTGY